MINETYETKTYVKTESVLVSERLYCDICGKEITGPHWSVMTGHHDWGNDSVDSVQHKDACSGLCKDLISARSSPSSGTTTGIPTMQATIRRFLFLKKRTSIT